MFKKDSYEPASWYHADNNGGNPVRYNSELMDMYDTLRDGDKLAQREPWELPRYFIVKNNLSRSSVRTKSGVWIEKEDDLIAVRSPESSSSTTTTTTPPSYVGVKKTFEFSLNDGTKTDWVMREYLQLHHNWSYPAASFVQDPGTHIASCTVHDELATVLLLERPFLIMYTICFVLPCRTMWCCVRYSGKGTQNIMRTPHRVTALRRNTWKLTKKHAPAVCIVT